ncbi:MAG: HAMP domain-containing sensor histidine kinase [Cyanobacteria bacterium P01_A01_bin.84]
MVNKFDSIGSKIIPPFLSEGSDGDLSLESTLNELSLYNFSVETSCSITEVVEVFEKYPLLPGVIVVEQGNYVGMISRQRLLEFFIRPHGQELFSQESVGVIYSYARTSILLLPQTTPVLTAMQIALRRSPELFSEPVVVKVEDNIYRLLSIQELSTVSWQIRGIETQVRYERSQAQMIQNDKMANLGRLVDGVAHEILDPVNFIWGNLTHVSNYTKDLINLITIYEQESKNTSRLVENLREEIEFDFLEEDLIKAIASIRTGAERLKKLVSSLQNFCHIDEVYPKPADLHTCINNNILLINSRLKGEIEIIKKYSSLPPIYCFVGQLSQVFMNILSYCVDALLNEAVRQQFNTDSENLVNTKPIITITTEIVSQQINSQEKIDGLDPRWIAIRISDNGMGISQETRKQIIDSFSVNNRADKETSLAVSYRIITARHGGKFNLHSKLGFGTEFEILLPLV